MTAIRSVYPGRLKSAVADKSPQKDMLLSARISAGEIPPSICKLFPAVGLALTVGLSACGNRSDPIPPAVATARTLGVPPGGPSVLYEPPPDIPQLQNRDARFRAPVQMVSGTERYIDGEYSYTDFIYDETATYPDDLARYAGNAADLVEFRMAMLPEGGLAIRFLLNTLLVPDSTIAVVAFDSDNDANTGSSNLPRDPGMPFPGTDQVLTTWGTGAEWSRWNGTSWDTTPLALHTDLEANQITVTAPKSVAQPSGQWSATLATGLYDAASGGWLELASNLPVALPVPLPLPSSGPKIINLGFRFSEIEAAPVHGQQTAALSANEPTRFAHLIDFELLRSRGYRDTVPTHGMLYRIFASRRPSVTLQLNNDPSPHGDTPFSEGRIGGFDIQYLSPLQPYAVYIPPGYDPATPAPMSFALHGIDAQYYWINESESAIPPSLGDARNAIVLSASGRGSGGFYIGDIEYDLLEAWNDVARHYTLDPRRTSVYGLSMGGYGAYRMGLLYPHLFAATVSYIPAMCRGLWIPGVIASGGEETLSNRWLENARNLPIFHIADTLSEITPYVGQLQQVLGPTVTGFQGLDALGYRYKFWSVAMDHALGVVFHGDFMPAISEFLGQREIEPEPFHVTYARMPSNDYPAGGLIHNRAYWLSDLELRDGSAALAKGVIDAVSLGFGTSDPTSTQSAAPGVVGPLAYVETQRTWSEPGKVPVENRIVIKATNIASVMIDPAAARVDCNVKLDIESDGPLAVTLLGCTQ